MKVTRIKLGGLFMTHRETDVALPDRGLVLVLGNNGQGKTALLEGIAQAGWGKSIKGGSPWHEGHAGYAEIEADGLVIRRSVTKAHAKKLEWKRAADPSMRTWPTTTKAQAELETVIGSFEVWRRCSVFRSRDAAAFSLATDGDRKRLLERMLGLERFDEGLDRCRVGRRAAGERLADAQRRLAQADEGAAQAAADHAQMSKIRADLGPAPDVHQAADDGARGAELQRAVTQAQREERGAQEAQARARAQAQELARREARYKGGLCPECGTPMPGRVAQLRDERAEQEAAGTRAEAQAALAQAETARQRAEYEAWLEAAAAGTECRKAAEAHALQASSLDSAIQAAAGRQAKQEAARAQAEADRSAELAHVQRFDAAEHVLGLKGVRAHLLGSALTGIQATANEVLAALWPGVTVALEQADEELELHIDGASCPGYEAASDGQRRKIDVALLLGLASLANAMRGRAPGLLLMDEVFDALDEDGVEALGDMLARMAAERPLIVTTHQDALAQHLRRRSALLLSVRAGVVTAH